METVQDLYLCTVCDTTPYFNIP